MILKLFVPYSSWVNLLEQEGTLTQLQTKQEDSFLLISVHVFLQHSFKHLEQLAIKHLIVNRNTKLL